MALAPATEYGAGGMLPAVMRRLPAGRSRVSIAQRGQRPLHLLQMRTEALNGRLPAPRSVPRCGRKMRSAAAHRDALRDGAWHGWERRL